MFACLLARSLDSRSRFTMCSRCKFWGIPARCSFAKYWEYFGVREIQCKPLWISLKLYFPIFGKNSNSVCLRFATCHHRATGVFFFLFFSSSSSKNRLVRSVLFQFVHLLKNLHHILQMKSKILNQPSYHGIKSTMAIPDIHVIHTTVDQILATLLTNSPGAISLPPTLPFYTKLY